ncbi:L,D-transpeptidase family protein [Actinomadura graeca]|uniref:L,D-transpeptidase family protein n=2 Tax=Actinomadura graeca TaxID=2750812 RepID=A0ABX8R5K6_9ACTN|nr:L,D-transpeptidase family protein [Actinomadura graeca]
MLRGFGEHGTGRRTPLTAGCAPVVLGAAVMLTAACASGANGETGGHGPPGSAAPPRRTPPVTIEPADGTRGARPDLGVVVTAVRGTLDRVDVRADGASRPVAGRLSADRRSWRARWPLRPGTAYTATTTGEDGRGGRTSATSRFSTLRPSATFRISDVTPARGEIVGVGMPVIVTFDRPITRRAAVERSLELRASRHVRGAWHWTGPRQVVFRPRRFWHARERVSLIAHTAGVRAAPGVYGASGHTTGFQVGRSRVSTVDALRHRMTVRIDGRPVRTVGISAGKGGRRAYTTTSGVHLTMGKGDPVVMSSAWMGVTDKKDPRFYKMKVRHAVQISSSGEYVHSAPWSVRSQGRENVSHGCVNAPPEFAGWFYAGSLRGDVVTVTGTSRPLEWNNGWGYWQLPWSRWVAGSALNRPVTSART